MKSIVWLENVILRTKHVAIMDDVYQVNGFVIIMMIVVIKVMNDALIVCKHFILIQIKHIKKN